MSEYRCILRLAAAICDAIGATVNSRNKIRKQMTTDEILK